MQLDRCTQARELLRCFLRQILRDGTFHADPHPGNIWVLRDGRLALLDFGSVGRLGPAQQAALQRLLIGQDRRNAGLLGDALLELAQDHTGVDEVRLERALAHLLAQRLGPEMLVGPELFRDLFALPRRLDRITAALEQGTLSVNVRLLADERDARFINRLVSRAVLAVLAQRWG